MTASKTPYPLSKSKIAEITAKIEQYKELFTKLALDSVKLARENLGHIEQLEHYSKYPDIEKPRSLRVKLASIYHHYPPESV